MIKTCLFLFVSVFSFSLSAQCLSGDCQSGTGRYRFSNGALYEGQMSFGKLHGTGKLIYSNGDMYEGGWNLNRREGQGILQTADGLIYDGRFIHNQLDGLVKVYDKKGGYFEGTWKDGQPIGTGVYISRDNSVPCIWTGNTYLVINQNTIPARAENDFTDCNLIPCNCDKGRFVFNDGSVFTGSFKNGLPDGEGECHYKNGDFYSGQWHEGKPDGNGRYLYATGITLNGTWEQGKFMDTNRENKTYAEGVNIYALIVGASRYDHFESLKYTDDDAYQVYAFLRSPEGGAIPDDHIRILIDESAIGENIYKGLDDIIAMAGPDDEVLVYLAGHGLQGFYVPTDSDGYRNRVEYDEIKKRLNECRAHQKLVIADACYSGSLLAAKTPMFESVDLFYKKLSSSGGGTAFLLSSKSEEFSLESQGLRQGIFSYYLIQGLKGEADQNKDRIVTLDELYTYVYREVRTYSGNLQTPVLAGDIDRSMPLASIR